MMIKIDKRLLHIRQRSCWILEGAAITRSSRRDIIISMRIHILVNDQQRQKERGEKKEYNLQIKMQ